MFEGIREYIRGRIMEMLSPGTITEAIGVELPINDVMTKRIQRWKSLYMDLNDWLEPEESNGFKSAGVAAAITSELTRLATVEMESEITGSNKRAKYLQDQYKKIVADMGIQTEYAAALGGMILKPYVDGNEIVVDYVQADRFFPVAFNSRGELTAVVFTEKVRRENYIYTRLEYHKHEGDRYSVKNRAYRKLSNSKTNTLGDPIDLNSVDEWKSLKSDTELENIKRPLYSYLKMPIANTADPESNLGISVFGRAENLIYQAERFWNAINWEFESKETAVDVNETMLKPITGLNGSVTYLGLPKGKERLFRMLDAQKSGDESFYKVFSPDIRADDFLKGYNKILQRIEFVCGLAYGTISDPNDVAKTATEIKISKQRSYATVTAIQESIEQALTGLIEAMNQWADLMKLPGGSYDVKFEFGDSVVTDLAAESAIRMQEVAAGLLKPEEYIKWRYGFKDDEQARAIMPGGGQIMDETTDETSASEE